MPEKSSTSPIKALRPDTSLASWREVLGPTQDVPSVNPQSTSIFNQPYKREEMTSTD